MLVSTGLRWKQEMERHAEGEKQAGWQQVRCPGFSTQLATGAGYLGPADSGVSQHKEAVRSPSALFSSKAELRARPCTSPAPNPCVSTFAAGAAKFG